MNAAILQFFWVCIEHKAIFLLYFQKRIILVKIILARASPGFLVSTLASLISAHFSLSRIVAII